MSKVKMPLRIFPMEVVSTKGAGRFQVMVEMDAEKILGSYGPREHDACMMVKLPNDGHLNWVFKQMGVPYALCPLPGTDAFTAATKKQKADTSRRVVAKKVMVIPAKATPVKAAPTKKISVLKVIQPKAKLRPRGMYEIELVLA
jgi:hypothetical protein